MIDLKHSECESPNEQQDCELADGGQGARQFRLAKADADDKIDHRRDGSEKEAAGHSLTIEHEEEGKIDQRGTRFLLKDDEHHWQENQSGCPQKASHVGHRETVAVQKLGDCERRDTLGKLRGLNVAKPEIDP